jgi:nucleotide-binding universal stress UspA family protein
MRCDSILLALSGSQQSRFATELCWSMANKLGAIVTAQHVVDSFNAWEFIGHEHPGFVDSEKYLRSYQRLCSDLFELGEELSTAYRAESAAHSQSPLFFLDEGNPVTEICSRAASHDLVVIGHRPTPATAGSRLMRQFQRLSIAESLANQCPRPLLIVQEPVKQWRNVAIVISTDHVNERFINCSLDMSVALKLEPTLICLAGGPELDFHTFAQDMRTANKRLTGLGIGLTELETLHCDSSNLLWSLPRASEVPRVDDQTLMIVPTRELNTARLSLLDGSASDFVRHSMLPSILLWPEEYLLQIEAPKVEQVKQESFDCYPV